MQQTSFKLNRTAVAAAILAATAGLASAQSADSLLDKLVEKGLLTDREARELREQADADFTRAYQVKSGMPDWVTSLKLNGDFRARFEGFYSNSSFTNGTKFVDRSRFRYRLRFGVTAVMMDDFEVGFRLSSSERNDNFGGDPISGNTTYADNASKKFLFIDLAYGKWTPVHGGGFSGNLIVGKMENPFTFSDMVFDHDYTPEGLASQWSYAINDDHTLKLNGGGFAIDEIGGSAQDPYLLGVQLRWDANWTYDEAHKPVLQTSAGVAFLNLWGKDNLTNGAIPNVNVGNTRGGGTRPPASHFNPIIGDLSATYNFKDFAYYKAPAFPVKLAAEYLHNPATSSRNESWFAGVTFGKAGKKGLWELQYRYKYLESNAWFEEFTDSDYGTFYAATPPNSQTGTENRAGYGAGTNIKGHVIKATYSPYDSVALSVTYFHTRPIDPVPAGTDGEIGRLQVDAIWKF
jgi:hypothetical protein